MQEKTAFLGGSAWFLWLFETTLEPSKSLPGCLGNLLDIRLEPGYPIENIHESNSSYILRNICDFFLNLLYKIRVFKEFSKPFNDYFLKILWEYREFIGFFGDVC